MDTNYNLCVLRFKTTLEIVRVESDQKGASQGA